MLGAVIFGSVVGVSAYTLLAADISYTPKDETWKKSNGDDITNVKDAIDELYDKTSFFDSLTYVKTTDLIYGDRNGNSQNFTLDSGKYILVVETRTVEYNNDFSLTGSPLLKQIGGVISTRSDGIANSSDQLYNLIHGRGGSFLKIYTIDTKDSVTLTFSIKNTVVETDAANYVSAGKVGIYKF